MNIENHISIHYDLNDLEQCQACFGDGKINDDRCNWCNGSGEVTEITNDKIIDESNSN